MSGRDPNTVYVGQTDQPYVEVRKPPTGVLSLTVHEPAARVSGVLLLSPDGARQLAEILRRLA